MTTGSMLRISLFAAALIAPLSSSAATMVLGNELGYKCSLAALSGQSDIASIDTCTAALESGAIAGRNRAGTFVNRGVIKLRRKEYKDARADFDAALAIEPTLGEALVNRGAAYLAEHRYAEALEEISRGLEFGADEPEKAYYNRGLAHEGLGEFTAAYLDYRKATELRPDWEQPRQSMARFTVKQR